MSVSDPWIVPGSEARTLEVVSPEASTIKIMSSSSSSKSKSVNWGELMLGMLVFGLFFLIYYPL